MSYFLMHRFVLSAAFLATTGWAEAALINWNAPQNITGASNVTTDGNLVGAFSLGGFGTPSTTVNTVPFLGFEIPNGNLATSGGFSFSKSVGTFGGFTNVFGSPGLEPEYNTLLVSGMEPFGGPEYVLTMSGLTVGQQYIFQWWANGSANVGPPEFTTAEDPFGNSVTLNQNVGNTLGGRGQYAIGTFTADTTLQTVKFTGPDPDNFTLLNGFQLRAGIPEPGTALGSCTALLIGFLKRTGRQQSRSAPM